MANRRDVVKQGEACVALRLLHWRG